MELTYKELQKRDVINIATGRCLGRMVDMKFCFPEGRIEGIVVPGKKGWCFGELFSKSTLYISERNIVKIGGDVILVDLSCENYGDGYVILEGKKGKGVNTSKKGCHPSPCPPPCPPSCPPNEAKVVNDFCDTEGGMFSDSERINFDEY